MTKGRTTCDYCGKTGLHWKNSGTRWMLYSENHREHRCTKYKKRKKRKLTRAREKEMLAALELGEVCCETYIRYGTWVGVGDMLAAEKLVELGMARILESFIPNECYRKLTITKKEVSRNRNGRRCCQCPEYDVPLEQRKWVVLNHRSSTSIVYCISCESQWISRAAYVDQLPRGH